MHLKVENEGFLYQDLVIGEIALTFGDCFTYINENGNAAIAKPVLSAFRKLSSNTVVWDKGERASRKRIESDLSCREQP